MPHLPFVQEQGNMTCDCNTSILLIGFNKVDCHLYLVARFAVATAGGATEHGGTIRGQRSADLLHNGCCN